MEAYEITFFLFGLWDYWHYHLVAVCLSNVGALTSRNPMDLHGL
jgi:hypothetical protein